MTIGKQLEDAMQYCDAENPKFFQVFLPDYNSEKLRIPPRFIKHFKGNMPEKVTLQDLSRNIWVAQMEIIENGLFMTHGWGKFVKEKYIEEGSFLTFEYDKGSSTFTITIFGRNACSRQEDLVCIKVEEDSEEEESEEITLSPETSEGAASSSQVEAHGNSPRDVEEHRMLESAEEGPSVISFRAHLYANRPHIMNIPKAPLVKHGIKLKKEMHIRDHRGKLWPITCKEQTDGRTLITAGFRAFSKHYQVNHKKHHLIFEFVVGKERKCKEFKVHIKKKQGKSPKQDLNSEI